MHVENKNIKEQLLVNIQMYNYHYKELIFSIKVSHNQTRHKEIHK